MRISDWMSDLCSSELFPGSAAALKSNRSGALRRVVIKGLRGTDARVRADEPVSPAFLFALLLWPAYCRALIALQAQGMHAVEAQRRAADRVTVHQLSTIALPRSEEHTSELQSLMRTSSAVFCLQKNNTFKT